MPQLQSITAFDRESTPSAHTFTPRGGNDGVHGFHESDGVPIGDNVITVSTRKAGDRYKSRLRLVMPTVVNETINGIVSPKIVRTAYADVNFTFEGTSTEQERKNVLGLLSSMFSGTDQPLIDGMVVDLEDAY